jgi:hypothetical protein
VRILCYSYIALNDISSLLKLIAKGSSATVATIYRTRAAIAITQSSFDIPKWTSWLKMDIKTIKVNSVSARFKRYTPTNMLLSVTNLRNNFLIIIVKYLVSYFFNKYPKLLRKAIVLAYFKVLFIMLQVVL